VSESLNFLSDRGIIIPLCLYIILLVI
jgi:hypothetical protein